MRTKLLRRAKKRVKLYEYKGNYHVDPDNYYGEVFKYKSNAMECYRRYVVDEAEDIVSYNYLKKRKLKRIKIIR